MHVVLAWFAADPAGAAAAEATRRFDAAVAPLVGDAYARHALGGGDWGAAVLHTRARGGYRWPVLADDGPVTAVSLGIPVGADAAAGPVTLARKLLAGHDVHADVVPPFGLLAVDTSGRFALQQDWLGMCRVYTGSAGGLTAYCSRTDLLVAFLGGGATPDPVGWASYLMCGHFGGGFAPVRGARLLDPGERVTGRRRDGGGWDVSSARRFDVDDVVRRGMDMRGAGLDGALDAAAAGFAATAKGLAGLYDDDITLGLSGGKDSRLMAAAMIAAGRLPRLRTHDDLPAEGETARRLVAVLRDKRGLAPVHEVGPAGAPAVVLRHGLRERVERMQRRYDYQFSSTYTVRPAGSGTLPRAPRPASLAGAGGELAVGYWYPTADGADDSDRATAERQALSSLLSAVPRRLAGAAAVEQETERIRGIVDHAAGLGLVGVELIDYVYLVERVRRWYSSGDHVGMVAPYTSPLFVSASFAMTPAQKRRRAVHYGLLERFLPEWVDIPYVTGRSGVSAAVRVWEGDGAQAIADLLDTAHGGLTALVRRDAVERALARCMAGQGNGALQKGLQQFAWLAVATGTLEPHAVRPATGASYARLTSAAAGRGGRIRPVLSAAAAKVSFGRRGRLGRLAWRAVRRLARQGRRS